jgi:cytidylate kinase
VAIVTGAPGTGKTSVAARLATAAPRGLHVPADVFYTFPVHPISPYRPAAQEQNTAIIAALARTAETFASRAYDVFLDGIVGPWFLPVVVAELAPSGIALDYVVLRAPLDVVLRRVRGREEIASEIARRRERGDFALRGA